MQDEEIARQNRNPAIERMMAILSELERRPNGLGLKRLAESTGVTRSTVYRILNSLVAHDMVRQLDNSDYVLGSRLLSLADAVTVSSLSSTVAITAQPHLDSLSFSLGETCKASVYDRGFVVVVAVAPGRKAHALHAQVGEYLPIHAGGASKVLLANLPAPEVDRLLERTLTRYTEQTICNQDELRRELEQVRDQGWARDHGEFNISINSYAAPIRNRADEVVAAISVPFLAGRDAAYESIVLDAALATAQKVSADIG